MQHAEIIRALGGPSRIARDLGTHQAVISRWQSFRRIPPRRWRWIIAYAAARGVRGVTLDALLSGYYPDPTPLPLPRSLAAKAARKRDKESTRAAA